MSVSECVLQVMHGLGLGGAVWAVFFLFLLAFWDGILPDLCPPGKTRDSAARRRW